MEEVPAALTGPRAAAEEDGAGVDAFDRECQKSQQRQSRATVAAVAIRAGRGWVTVPFLVLNIASQRLGYRRLD